MLFYSTNMITFLLQIVQNFEFECLNKDEVTANTSQVLVPSRDIQLSFTLRQTEKRQFDKVTV